jgi:hypothetical protein
MDVAHETLMRHFEEDREHVPVWVESSQEARKQDIDQFKRRINLAVTMFPGLERWTMRWAPEPTSSGMDA